MKEKSNTIRRTRNAILYLIAIIIALATVTPVLAAYLGPNRTVTETVGVCKVVLYECQFSSTKNIWKYKAVNDWNCANESKPWRSYSNQAASCNSINDGYTYWQREDSLQEVINTYPPATIGSALVNCTLNNGWCTTLPQLSLTGTEPVANFNITAIEGALNGQNFACANASCNVPLLQGNNDLSYWALSSWGDSSTMGVLSIKVDSQLPTITGSLSGTTGSNGWYLSSVTFTGSASDATSGLANFTCTLDNTVLGSCSSIDINGEGPHTLLLTVQDNAGNIRKLTQNTLVDIQNPTLNASINGTAGSNSWYTAATLTALASDPTPGSGLSALEYNLDNTAWTAFPVSGELVLPEGKHSIDLRAIDIAGRTTLSSKFFWLDSVAPAINIDPSGGVGANDWYITNLTLQASATDNTSGVDVFDYTLDNNSWSPYTTPLTIIDGSHTISFWAQDHAGLVTQVNRTYFVDTRPPQIAGSISGTPGMNQWYVSNVTLSASAADPLPGSGIDAFTYILDGEAETPYTNALTLSDGQHVIQFAAKDKAGLTYTAKQTIKVDTISPSLNVSTVLPNWVKQGVTLSGTADDTGSGLSTLEISTDGGQTWQAVTGVSSWTYNWDTFNTNNGLHNIHVRAIDTAGLTTEKIINAGIDNDAPKISMPESWYQWDTTQLDVWDNHSGLSNVYVEISDPAGRWKKRVIQLDPEKFPMNFKWDRRFGDDTVAPPGTYDLKLFAVDNLGNRARQSASVKILLGILPAGPTATPYIRLETTPTAIYTATPFSSPTITPTAMVSVFGEIEPTVQTTATVEVLSTPRPAPTQSSVIEWLESIFDSNTDSKSSVTELKSDEPLDADGTYPQSSVLWGSSAAALVGALTGSALEERRKRQEKKAAQIDAEAEEEDRREKIKERQLAKNEAKRAQEEALREAQLERAWNPVHFNSKVEKLEFEETKSWVNSQIAVQQQYIDKKKAEEEKKKKQELETGLEAYYNAMKQGLQEAPKTEPNWWDKTKLFVNENIIQPVNEYVYQPYVKPVTDFRNQLLKKAVSWLDGKVYQPYMKQGLEDLWEFTKRDFAQLNEKVLKPTSEIVGEATLKGLGWLNEKVYQPLIKPWVEHRLEVASERLELINKKVYQPYIKPVIKVINETVIQPYIEPIMQKAGEQVVEFTSLVNTKIYEPIFEPVVNDINHYIFDPLTQKITNWWDQYGEWVHGALDAAGFIPGFGDIGDGINCLVYLCEGRYLEASISAVSAIPLIGYLGTSGKLVIQASQEVVDTVVGKIVKEIAGETIEKLAKESLEEGAEKAILQTTQQLARTQWAERVLDLVGCIPGADNASATIKSLVQLTNGHYLDASVSAISMIPIVGNVVTTSKSILESSIQRVIKETAEEIREKLIKESVETELELTIKEISEETVEKIVKEGGEELAEKTTKETLELVENKTIKEMAEEAIDKTTKETLEDFVENTSNKVKKNIREDVSESVIEDATKDNTKEDAQDTKENAEIVKNTEKIPQRIDKAQFVEGLKEQYGEEMVAKFLPFCEKYGIDPYDILTRPPMEGQSLIGWGLGIDNPANPANHPLVELKLTRDELNRILSQNTVRPDSKVVVLGFGGADKPYYQLSNEIDGCHLSLPDDVWAPFNKARGNFLVDINIPFIEKGIEERKIFLFNINKNTVIDPLNGGRFSLPELRLIEMPNNNYVQVEFDNYELYVPKELENSYLEHLPTALTGGIK